MITPEQGFTGLLLIGSFLSNRGKVLTLPGKILYAPEGLEGLSSRRLSGENANIFLKQLEKYVARSLQGRRGVPRPTQESKGPPEKSLGTPQRERGDPGQEPVDRSSSRYDQEPDPERPREGVEKKIQGGAKANPRSGKDLKTVSDFFRSEIEDFPRIPAGQSVWTA